MPTPRPTDPLKTSSTGSSPIRWLRAIFLPFGFLFKSLLFFIRRPVWFLGIALTVCIALLFLQRGSVSVQLSGSKAIQLTPEQITSIRNIRQWECLSIDTEEWVDTLRKGFFTDDRLARIYRGTLRLGIDLTKTQTGWLTSNGDTVTLRLPDIALLNPRFIDEARTRSFHESGTWKSEAKEAMYRNAHNRMLRRGFTQQNIKEARNNAREQFTALFRTFGYHTVHIEFVRPTKSGQ